MTRAAICMKRSLFQGNNLLGTFSIFQNYQKQRYRYLWNAQHTHSLFQHPRAVSLARLRPPIFSQILGFLFHFDHACYAWPSAEILLLLIQHELMLLNTVCLVFAKERDLNAKLSSAPGFEEGWFVLFWRHGTCHSLGGRPWLFWLLCWRWIYSRKMLFSGIRFISEFSFKPWRLFTSITESTWFSFWPSSMAPLESFPHTMWKMRNEWELEAGPSFWSSKMGKDMPCGLSGWPDSLSRSWTIWFLFNLPLPYVPDI